MKQTSINNLHGHICTQRNALFHLIIMRTTQLEGLALEVYAVECHRLKKKCLVARGSRTVKSINHKTEGKISLKEALTKIQWKQGASKLQTLSIMDKFGNPLLQRWWVNHLRCFIDASALEEGKILVSVDVTGQYRVSFGLNREWNVNIK